VFGLGFGEMVVLGIVLLVVVGPKELPRLLRGLGKGINKLRRMSSDLREQSGIDEIIKEEGLREDLDALRSLSRGRAGLVEGLVNSASKPARRPLARPRALAPALEELRPPEGAPPDPDAEYPLVGPDAYGARADDAPDDDAPDDDAPDDDAPDDDAPDDDAPDDDAPDDEEGLGAKRANGASLGAKT
jgi:sec-independent protein translocase protein TatB